MQFADLISRRQLQELGIEYCEEEKNWRYDVVKNKNEYLRFFLWIESIRLANSRKGEYEKPAMDTYLDNKLKNAIKRFLAVSCVVALFMTTPGVIVLADEIHEDISVSDVLDDNSIAPVIEESVPEVIEEEVATETDGTTEVTEYITDEFAEADQIEEDSSVDEVLSESTEESQTDSVEETVGANTWTVGDGVTASLVKEGNKDVLYLDSKGGTLRRS